MFVHDGLLQPALGPSDYGSAQAFQRERDTIFRHGFHAVATRGQLARHGAYVATDIAGLPVLMRNEDGALCAFVNVCAHRQSLLEAPGCGVRDALRCRYHGWEYDCQGALNKLPDGRSFKGIKAADYRLRKLRVETLGPLVYVSLDEAGPGLRESLGPLAEELTPFYERPLRPLWVRVTEHDVDWKIIVENAVESYHVPIVHPRTFRYYREPALHDHRIEPNFTRYADLEPWSKSASGRAFSLLAKAVLHNSDGRRFRHAHAFPNQLYYYGDLYCDLSTVVPLGPKRARHTSFGFVPDGLRLGRATAPLMRLLGVALEYQSRRIFAEDLSVWAAVQAGVMHAERRGVLSAREERVWAFQRWVAAQTASPAGELVTREELLGAALSRTRGR